MSTKILLTDNLVSDAIDKGLKISDAIEKEYAGVIADLRAKNDAFKNLNGLELCMYSSGLTKNSKIKDFYTSGNNELLFPTIIDSRLQETVAKSPMLSLIVGSEQTIDGNSVKALKLDLTSDENKKALKKRTVAEGSDLPTVTITTGKKAISLYKRGVAVEATYESIKHTTLDMFSKTIDVIAANSANQQMGDAIEVLLNGDGNDNAPQSVTTADTTLTNKDLINFALEFYDRNNGIVLDTLLCDKDTYMSLVTMVTSSNEQNTYKLGTSFKFPQGAFKDLTVIYDSRIPKVSSKSQIIGLNRSNALTRYIESGSIIRELDRNIRNQTHLGTLSETVGFAKFIDNASMVLKLK